ncbi:MAG: 16S rRNA (adenine(1518)-N(6)/adenine(1519)-N(6))-dimethyltransferase RsmA [Bdellovibrionales bacterium]
MSATDWPDSIKSLPPLRAVITQYELAAKKSLGQNFLLDLNVTDKIARAAGDLTDKTVIEIGPGPGGLTRALLANGARQVVAIERDRRCVAALQDLVRASDGRLRIIEDDAQKVDVEKLGPAPRVVVANLPYNIGTDLLIGWLLNGAAYHSLTLMFQKEVASRLVAQVNTEDYGRLSVLAQVASTPKIMMTLPPNAFTPPPKVHSAVVRLVPKPPAASLDMLGRVTAAAFGQRRKMIRSSLGSLFTEQQLAALGLNPEARAETLAVEDYVRLANHLSH